MIKNSLVKIKDGPPYAPGLERQVLLNSTARATLNGKTGSYEFTKLSNSAVLDVSNGKAVADMISDKAYSASDAVGVGVDHGKSEHSYSQNSISDPTRANLCRTISQPDLRRA